FMQDRLSSRQPLNGNAVIDKAKQYIEARLDEKITLEELARHLHFSSGYFSVFFKKTTGRSFTDYLNETRIEKAKSLLLVSDLLIRAISQPVGFNETSHFCKVCKKVTGVTLHIYSTK